MPIPTCNYQPAIRGKLVNLIWVQRFQYKTGFPSIPISLWVDLPKNSSQEHALWEHLQLSHAD